MSKIAGAHFEPVLENVLFNVKYTDFLPTEPHVCQHSNCGELLER